MNTLDTPPPNFNVDQAIEIARQHYGLDATAKPLGSERDQNFLLEAGSRGKFVLKIANPAEQESVAQFQAHALRYLEQSAPQLPVPRLIATVAGAELAQVSAGADALCRVRLVSYLEGTLVGHSADATTALQRSLGQTLAQLGLGLRGFFHPSARYDLLWNLVEAPKLRRHLEHISVVTDRQRVAEVLHRFEQFVAPELSRLRAQVIHNDLNPGNAIVGPDDPNKVTGVIDFGDLMHAPLIVDVAVACAYQLSDSDHPLGPAAELVKAYHQVTPLEDAELGVLFDLIATRVAMTITISSWRATTHPENREYILTSHPRALRLLQRLSKINRDDAADYFRQSCGLPQNSATEDFGDLAQRRDRFLGPSYRLFYDRPLHFVRGQGAWLYDAQGQRFLDVYNNVPHVGHAHPRVVAAIAAQAGKINTHTRYLHRNVVDYAQRLTELLPFDDAVCLFCCSGSEANELAYRIAQVHTGATGVLVTANAYHGNAGMTAQFSTADMPLELRHDCIEPLAAPDAYRGAHLHGQKNLADHFIGQLGDSIDNLANRNIAPAMLLVDTIFSCDGIITVPDGFLAKAAEKIRDAGGLFVADEVQAGFGRTGEHFWGFQRHGFTPDIVTLGKPMGNGYPLAAVICPRAIVEQFAQQFDYFNTFGGSPVACAAGMAVLDIIEDEALQQNALHVGQYLRERLHLLQEQHEIIGDVRGAGLFTGIELILDRSSLKPATKQAIKIVNALRDRSILIGATGRDGNVLKLRPPMVFSKKQVDLLVLGLQESLATNHA